MNGALTVKDWFTFGAALKFAFPPCEAWTVTVPGAPVSVMVLPLTEAGPDRIVNVTGNPEEALALIVNGASVVAWFGMGLNVMVWLAGLTCCTTMADVLAACVASPE